MGKFVEKVVEKWMVFCFSFTYNCFRTPSSPLCAGGYFNSDYSYLHQDRRIVYVYDIGRHSQDYVSSKVNPF
jgi:hypothetical protein